MGLAPGARAQAPAASRPLRSARRRGGGAPCRGHFLLRARAGGIAAGTWLPPPRGRKCGSRPPAGAAPALPHAPPTPATPASPARPRSFRASDPREPPPSAASRGGPVRGASSGPRGLGSRRPRRPDRFPVRAGGRTCWGEGAGPPKALAAPPPPPRARSVRTEGNGKEPPLSSPELPPSPRLDLPVPALDHALCVSLEFAKLFACSRKYCKQLQNKGGPTKSQCQGLIGP